MSVSDTAAKTVDINVNKQVNINKFMINKSYIIFLIKL